MSKNKLKIIYTATDNIVVSDFEAKRWVDENIEKYLRNRPATAEIRIGTELMLDLFALRVMEGVLPMEDVSFYYENIPLVFDKYDGIELPDNCPPFGWAMVSMEIIRLGYERLKNDKNL